jgi:hypothetical protein
MAAEYRDPKPIARAAILWTWIWLICQSLYGLASLYALSILVTLPPETPVTFEESPPELATSDLVLLAPVLLNFVTFLISGFLILKWIYRTNANAHIYSNEMNVGPGWNIGFFFIPIANLWKPFQGLREAWETFHWHDKVVPGWMRWWWGCWLATNFVDNLSFRIQLQGETAEAATAAAVLDIVSAIVSVPLALLLVRLIRTLTAAQEAVRHSETFA